MNDYACPALLRVNAATLQIPATAYGMHLNLDDFDEGLPSAQPLAAHRADLCIEYNGRRREFAWEEFFMLVGLDQ